jgi:hypothetical protein
MILQSFGCSFLDGTDLDSEKNSWPKLIANQLNLPYMCYAKGGAGNLYILDTILRHASKYTTKLCLINWTWIDRFDFFSSSVEKWETLRPSLDHPLGGFYYRNFNGQYTDMLTNLLYVKTAIDFLQSEKIKFVMTFMDTTLFNDVLSSWHDPRAVSRLQRTIKPYMSSFDGLTFLEWSKKHQFPISSTLHPLDAAHSAAANYWLPHIKELL